jgi:alcohol dehydrogenase (NADP+)
METLVPKKLTRFIGIANFSPKQVDEILQVATIKPKVLQIELHPYLQQESFVASTLKKGIAVTAWAPLGNTSPAYANPGNKAPKLLTNPVINQIAKAKGCTPAQVVLAWNMARGVVVIPKAANLQHQKENIAALEKCKLQSEDVTTLKSVQIPLRMLSMPCAMLKNACFDGTDKGF